MTARASLGLSTMLLAGSLICACGAAGAGPTAPTGRVTGSIVYAGGPPGAPVTRQLGDVRALQHGRTIARAHARERQRFYLKLAPGSYVLRTSSGDAQCSDHSLRVRRAHTTAVRITCSVK